MKKTLRIFVIIIAVLGFVSAGGFLWLRSDGGLAWLARTISTQTKGVTISSLRGSFPNDLHVGNLTVRDEKGVWLEITDAHVAWQPLAALRGQWRVDEIEAAQVRVLRKLEASPDDRPQSNFSLPFLPDITIGRIAIDTIILEAPVTGNAQRLHLAGGGNASGFDLKARSTEGVATALNAHIVWKGNMNASFTFDEAQGGLIATLLKLPSNQALHISLRADEQSGTFHIRDMQANAGSAMLIANGSYSPSTKVIAGRFQLNLPDISMFSNLSGTPLAGGLEANGTLGGSITTPLAQLSAKSDQLVIGTNQFDNVALQGDWKPKENKQLFQLVAKATLQNKAILFDAIGEKEGSIVSLSSLKANYDKFQLSGKANTHLDEKQFSAELALAPFLQEISGEMAKISGAITAKGSYQTFAIDANVGTKSPSLKSVIHAKGSMDVAANRFDGDISGNAVRSGKRFAFKSPIIAQPEQVNLSSLLLKGEGISLNGNALWLMQKKQANAALKLNAPDLAPLGKMLGTTLSGHAKATLNLIPAKQQQGKLIIAAGDVTVGTTQINKLAVHLEGNQTHITGNAQASGDAVGNPFTILIDSVGERHAKSTELFFNTFSGSVKGAPFKLAAPAKLTIGDNSVELSPSTLNLANGTLQFNVTKTLKSIAAELKATHIALHKLPFGNLPNGIVDAMVVISGTPQKPVATLRAGGTAQPSGLPLNYKINGNWKADKFIVDGSVNAKQAALTFQTTMEAAFSLSPVIIGLNSTTPLKGKVELNAPLKALQSYARTQGITLAGDVSGGATLLGTLGTPLFDGTLHLKEGSIDHKDSGICLRNMSATMLANRERITLQQFNAKSTDGNLDAQGSLALDETKALNGQMDFSRFGMFCGGLAKGNIGGQIKATGSTDAARLAGTLKIESLNVQLPGQAPGRIAIPQVEVVRVNQPSPLAKAGEPLKLDITLNAPERIFVRGRGLDAEFGGNLAITGTANAPQVRGKFAARKGRFTLLDRELKLSDATLRFNGPIPPSPYLDATATTTAQNTVIQMRLSGQAQKPVFSFSSNPILPKDQILALLLFGRSLAKLTPFQAIQLAQSVAELSGKTSGPGVLGRLRGALGVDRLDVSSSTDNSVTIGAGKYITDKVYVGVTQGAQPQDRAVTTEVEIVPNVSATTSVNSEGQQNLGLQWSYDY